MDRRTLLAVVLALGTYWMWTAWVASTQPPPPPFDPTLDGEMVDTDSVVEADPVLPVPVATAPVPAAEPSWGADFPEREVVFEGCRTRSTFSTKGGVMHSLTFLDHQAAFEMQPIWTWLIGRVSGSVEGPWAPYGEEPGAEILVSDKGRVLSMGSGSLDSASPNVEVVEQRPGHLVLRGITADGIEVTRTFTVNQTEEYCAADLQTSWRNIGSSSYSGDLWFAMHDVMPAKPANYANSVFPYAMVDGTYEWKGNMEKLDGPELVEGPVDWLALTDRYFSLVFIPKAEAAGALYWSGTMIGEEQAWGEHYVIERSLAPGETFSETFTMFAGPKEIATFKALHPRLDKLVNLGWFAFFARILLLLLRMVYSVIGQWGLAIIGLTVLIKALFFPLTQTSFKSSQAMQELQPELQKIREEFKEQPEELNKRTMELFRESGVNPLGGCLPMLIQMPVWIALYAVLLNSVELYHTEFLYLRDLSSVDPYGVMPLVVVGLMLVQQQFMPTGNMDPAQARMMKLMPLIFGFFFFTFPSGLVLYIFVNMVLTIIQQWYIRRTFKDMSAPVPATTA